MDFIERIFGVSPDDGTGALEWGLLLVALAVIAGVAALRRRARLRQRGLGAARQDGLIGRSE